MCPASSRPALWFISLVQGGRLVGAASEKQEFYSASLPGYGAALRQFTNRMFRRPSLQSKLSVFGPGYRYGPRQTAHTAWLEGGRFSYFYLIKAVDNLTRSFTHISISLPRAGLSALRIHMRLGSVAPNAPSSAQFTTLAEFIRSGHERVCRNQYR